VQAGLRRSLRLKAKEVAKKEEEEKKEWKEDDSFLTDIKTYLDFESSEESGGASQEILNSIGGLLFRIIWIHGKQYWVYLKHGFRGDGLWSLSWVWTYSFSGFHLRTGIKGIIWRHNRLLSWRSYPNIWLTRFSFQSQSCFQRK
jgi:hypothetical protein